MKDKTKYLLITLGLLLLVFYSNGAEVQSSFADFNTDDIGGWFKGLPDNSQTLVLVVIGLVAASLFIAMLLR